MKKFIALFLVLVLAFSFGACESILTEPADETATVTATPQPTTKPSPTPTPVPEDKPLFTVRSNDTIGATHHTVVGGDYEPDGTYKIVCTSGHGAITINEVNLTMLAADDYAGTEYSGLTYETSVEMELTGNDYITARAFNASEFKLEFYYVSE